MKKILSLVVLAVAAMAIVSCGKVKILSEVVQAEENKDVARLVAIGDSVKGLGDKADGQEQACGVCSYLAAYAFITASINGDSSFKNAQQYADPAKRNDFAQNLVALYDSSMKKDPDSAKKIFSEFEEGCKGALKVDNVIKDAKDYIATYKQAVAAQSADAQSADAQNASADDANASDDGDDAAQQ